MSDGYSSLDDFQRIVESDHVTATELLNGGVFGSLFGSNIIVSNIVRLGTVFTLGEPEYVGVMPVRREVGVSDGILEFGRTTTPDADFRIVGDNNANAVILDAGIANVGINSASPQC
jgi:hypothetical protein